MVALFTVASQRKYEPGVMLSRDRPFIPAAGRMDASWVGGILLHKHGAGGISGSGHPVAVFLQPKQPFEGCFHQPTSPIGSRV